MVCERPGGGVRGGGTAEELDGVRGS